MTAWGALVQQRRCQHVGDTGGDGDDNVGDSGAGSDGGSFASGGSIGDDERDGSAGGGSGGVDRDSHGRRKVQQLS